QRALFAKRQKRANLGVFFSDSRVAILSQRGRARLPLRDLAPNLINRHGTKSSGIWLSTAISQSPWALRKTSRPCLEHSSRRCRAAAICADRLSRRRGWHTRSARFPA